MKNESYVCFTIYKHQIMKIKRLTLIALLFALCLIHPLFGDTIPTEVGMMSIIVPLIQIVLQ